MFGIPPFRIVYYSWLALAAFWLISALSVKQTKSTEGLASRLAHVVPLAIGAGLVFSRSILFGFLGYRFVPDTMIVAIVGCILTCLGVAFAIWARYHLGRNWSGMVKIREGHELIRTGPYALVRHPIYSGILLGLIGTALVVGEWRAVIGVLVISAALIRKAKTEEAMLKVEFGNAFTKHIKSTGFLVPHLRR